MKLKKVLAVSMAALMTFSMVACGSTSNGGNSATNSPTAKASTPASATAAPSATPEETTTSDNGTVAYKDIVLGETYKDLTATIKVLSHRTDLADTKFKEYVAEFKKLYPNITVQYETVTDYANQALLRISQSDWDIMMIPAVDKKDLGTYFVPYGSLDDMNQVINYATAWEFNKEVYGVPSTANAQGIVYNKAVFEKAGITSIPKTPSEFINALKAIKDKTDATPLYTNYAAEWTMGAWDAYLGGSATGDANYMNQLFIHEAAPFANRGDDTHAYAVYKVLYDAVKDGLIEDDYTTTDWEGCKGMINNGQIGCMVLGSWAITQMKEAGEHPDDIGYMSFPITVNGKQYASAGADYSYGINVKASEDNQKAAMLFVRWLTDKSGFSYSEGGLPISKDGQTPEVYAAFDGIEFVVDNPSKDGEESYLNDINTESELMINAGGNKKVMGIIEAAAQDTKSFDDIMAEWNTAWNDAQKKLNIEAK